MNLNGVGAALMAVASLGAMASCDGSRAASHQGRRLKTAIRGDVRTLREGFQYTMAVPVGTSAAAIEQAAHELCEGWTLSCSVLGFVGRSTAPDSDEIDEALPSLAYELDLGSPFEGESSRFDCALFRQATEDRCLEKS